MSMPVSINLSIVHTLEYAGPPRGRRTPPCRYRRIAGCRGDEGSGLAVRHEAEIIEAVRS